MRFFELRSYKGEPLEKGGTSIPGKAAPAIRALLTSGEIKPGMTVLDFGAGKFARNANYLRDNGVKVYAYDPHHSLGSTGWNGVSNSLPKQKFDVAFSSFVLNVVPDHIEDKLLKQMGSLSKTELHITRNKDIFETIKRALLRKDKLVGGFFLSQYANPEEKEAYEAGKLSDDVIMDFCRHGVQTSKGFQRIPFLEEKGYSLIRNTSGFKVYKK